MVDAPDTLMLIDLRRLDAKMDRVIQDLADVRIRRTAVEEAAVRLTHGVDRLETPVVPIERRRGLVEMPH